MLTKTDSTKCGNNCLQSHDECSTPLHEKCLQHHGQKGNLRVMHKFRGAIGDRAQVVLVWVRALGIENTSHHKNYESCELGHEI